MIGIAGRIKHILRGWEKGYHLLNKGEVVFRGFVGIFDLEQLKKLLGLSQ